MACRSRNRQSELRLVQIRCLRSLATISTKVRSGCSATSAKIRAANCSSGETPPPRGFGAALLLAPQRCNHLIAELVLMSKCSAASRRDAPLATASITRSRRSPEYDLGIAPPSNEESMRKASLILSLRGIPKIQFGRKPLQT